MNGGDAAPLTDADWASFGYDTDKPCEICGGGPAKEEPRFGYKACREHAAVPPVRFRPELFKE